MKTDGVHMMCAGCHRETDVDNNRELCRRCHGSQSHPKIDATPGNPYRRGIGQGFGSTDDGD